MRTPGILPSGYGRKRLQNRFHGGTIYNDAAYGLIWVENQVSLGANETLLGNRDLNSGCENKQVLRSPVTVVITICLW